MSNHRTILIVDDSAQAQLIYRRYLTQETRYHYDIVGFDSGERALAWCQQATPDLILLDYLLPDINGLQFLRALRQQDDRYPIPVVVLTGNGDETVAVEFMKQGVQDYAVKDRITSKGLRQAVYSNLERSRLLRELDQQQEQQRLITKIALQIRQSLDLREILNTAVAEVQQLLQADRVVVCQFGTGSKGSIVAESVLPVWTSLLNTQIDNAQLLENGGSRCCPSEAQIVHSLEASKLTDEYIQFLKQFQVQARLVVPILLEPQEEVCMGAGCDLKQVTPCLWGLLIVHQCQAAREWQAFEIDLLDQLSTQLAIAIRQAELYQSVQALNAALEEKVQQRTAELQQVNQELKTSERKFRAIFDNTFQYTGLLTPDGILLEANQTALDFAGIEREAVVNHPVWQTAWWKTSFETQQQLQQAIARAAEGEFIRYEVDISGAGDEIATIDFSLRPLKDEAGQVVLLILEGRNISDRKRVEQERDQLLQTLEQHNQLLEEQVTQRTVELRTMIDALPDYVFVISREQMRLMYCNDAYAQGVCQLPRKQVENRMMTEFLSPENAVYFAQQNQQVFASGESLRIQETITLPTGTYNFDTIKTPLKNLNGETYAILATARDMTSAIQLESALNQSEVRFRDLVETSSDWIWEVNENALYTYVSPQVTNILGYRPEEVLGKTPFDLMPPEEAQRVAELFGAKIAMSAPLQCLENINRHQDGRLVTLETSGVPIFDAEGQFRGYRGMDRDITARKQAEQALQHSEEQFRTVFDFAPIAICLARVDNYQIFRVNAAHRQLFGYSDAELATMSFEDFTHPDDVEKDVERVRQMVRGETSGFRMEKRFVKKNGDVILTNMTVALIRDRNNVPLYSMGMFEDITEQKQSEVLLKAQQEFLRRLIDTVPNLIFVKDWEGRFTLVNQATADVYQSTIDDLIGKTDADFNPNRAEVEQFLAADREVMATRTAKVLEETITAANGKQRYFQTIKTPIMPGDGHSREVLGVATDISDRKQIEEQLRLSEAHLVEAQHIAHVGSWQFDIVKQKITWSAETFRIFGRDLAQQEPTYEELIQAVHPEDRENYKAIFQWAVEQVQPFELEHRVVQLDGNVTYVLGKGQPIVDQTGKLLSFLGTALDITSRKQFEEQLRQTNEQLARTNVELARATRLKDEFLANMSHELRTPLNAILGMTEGLQEGVFGSVNEKQIKSLQTIERSGFHLLALINDILDIAKIESGQLELDCASTAVAPLCQSSLAFIQQQALKKHIQLDIKLPLNLPSLFVDERRIRQVLINLLNNSVKFTLEGGRVTLEVISPNLSVEEPGEDDYLRIAVIDTGIGIEPEHLNKLFQPFIQIDSALNRKYQGTGLGLALAKRIVELHGGQIGLTSEVGIGSCFTISLPCVTSTPSLLELEAKPQFQIETSHLKQETSPLILLAEDNEANIITISSYLRAKGYRIVLARNGQEAIALAQSAQPDLMLMDIQMPGMDGLEAMQQIRCAPHSVDVPIIALTALAMTGDGDRCLAAGANAYLAKPVKLKQLVTTIQQLLNLA